MFAIAFDLHVRQTEASHPKGRASAAYDEIAKLLAARGFQWVQGSVYLTKSEDLSLLFARHERPQSASLVFELRPGHQSLPRRAMVGLHGLL